jgi:hypothetical protein
MFTSRKGKTGASLKPESKTHSALEALIILFKAFPERPGNEVPRNEARKRAGGNRPKTACKGNRQALPRKARKAHLPETTMPRPLEGTGPWLPRKPQQKAPSPEKTLRRKGEKNVPEDGVPPPG